MIRFRAFLFLMMFFLAVAFPVGAAEITYKSSYGNVDVKFGVVTGGLDGAKTSELLQYFGHEGGKEIFLKIDNPNISLLTSNEFTTLSQKKFKWYFSFSNTGGIESFMTSYFQKTNNEVVVELDKTQAAFAKTLKQKFPSVKIHIGKFTLWPREDVKELLDQVSPSVIDAYTIQTDGSTFQPDLFDEVKAYYDVFFDASMDIRGGSSIKMDYQSGTKLGVSKVKLPDTSTKAMAFLNGAISSVVVSSVSTQKNSKKAPFKYVIVDDFFKLPASEKKVLGTIASALHSKGGVVWPMAIEQNGDPWDNAFFSESDTKPIVGFVANSAIGSYIVITNTSSSSESVKVPSSVNGLPFISSSGTQSTISANPFQMTAYETYVIVSSAAHIPGNVAPTIPPATPTTAQAQPTAVPTQSQQQPTQPATLPTTSSQPTLAVPTQSGGLPIFQQPTSAPAIPTSSSSEPPVTAPIQQSTTEVVSFYDVNGNIEIVNPKLKQLEKMLIVLNSNSKKYPAQTLESIPLQSGAVPFQFKSLATGVTYQLEAYVKSPDGFVYRASGKCENSTVFGGCVIKKAQQVNLKINVEEGASPDKILSVVDTVLNLPVTIAQQVKRIDILLSRQALNLQRRALLLLP